MRLTTLTDFSLRMLIHLAIKPDGRATIAEVAKAYRISEAHLMKVAHLLGQQARVVGVAGATILGRIIIGRGSTIGGNVWVTKSVPPDSHLTQAPPHHELFIHGGGI